MPHGHVQQPIYKGGMNRMNVIQHTAAACPMSDPSLHVEEVTYCDGMHKVQGWIQDFWPEV